MLSSAFVFSLVASAASVVANPVGVGVGVSVPLKPQASKHDGTYVTKLSQCPELASRGAPTSLHDL